MYVDGNCLQLICQQEDYITYKGSIDLPSANAGGEKRIQMESEPVIVCR